MKKSAGFVVNFKFYIVVFPFSFLLFIFSDQYSTISQNFIIVCN
jgi:hypothetical protein